MLKNSLVWAITMLSGASPIMAQPTTTGPAIMLSVEGIDKKPIAGATFTVLGQAGVSPPTTTSGRTIIQLAPGTKPLTWITLRLLSSPPGKSLVILSPWDEQAMVPAFDNATQSFVSVVLVERKARGLLENPDALAILMRRTLGTSEVNLVERRSNDVPLESARARVAQAFGLSTNALDTALRSWSRTASTPVDSGLAALYAGQYAKADSAFLQADTSAEDRLIDVRRFEASSFHQQERYGEAVKTLTSLLAIRPEDPELQERLGQELLYVAYYARADSLLRQAIAREDALGIQDPTLLHALGALANVLTAEHQAAQAIPIARRALDLAQRITGPPNPEIEVSIAMANLGDLLARQNDSASADSLFQRSLSMIEKSSVPVSPELTARILNGIALLREHTGHLAVAESLFQRSLATIATVKGTQLRTASILNTFGQLLTAEHKFAAARSILDSALHIKQRELGDDSPDVAFTLMTIADSHIAEGHYQIAESFYRQAVTIYMRNHDSTSFNAIVNLSALGRTLAAEGRDTAAEDQYRGILRIMENPPKNSDLLANVLMDFGLVYIKEEKYAAADTQLDHAQAVIEQGHPSNDLQLAAVLGMRAVVRFRQQDFVGANQLYRRALPVWEANLRADGSGIDSLWYANVLESFAETLDMLHDKPGSIALLKRTLAIRRAKLGPDDPTTMLIMYDLARELHTATYYTSADSIFRDLVPQCERIFGPNHVQTGFTIASWAWTRRFLDDPVGTDTLFQRAVSIFDKLGHPDSQTLYHYGLFKQDRGMTQDAKRLFRQALALQEKELGMHAPATEATRQALAKLTP
ncbi:MAG TPA: tetratricopeptide repeat protein [Gemmatimonadaceae bacterium]|nr:tetratricopeptide repeat protein [Gemmatimonadaceae bacterium]